MRNLAIIILLVSSVLSSRAQLWDPCFQSLTPINGTFSCETYDEWVLVFKDNFDGTSLDETVWHDSSALRNRFCNANEAQYYTTGENISISNGYLTLIAEEESITALTIDYEGPDYDLMCDGEYVGENEETFDYKSGQIVSKLDFMHGKFEIRCQIPSIELLWPAFWIYGDCGQEIDVFEFMDESTNPTIAGKKITYTYHRDYDCPSETWTCNDEQNTGEDMSLEMHTYSVEWDEHKIRWIVDGNIELERYRFYNTSGVPQTLCGTFSYQYWIQDRIYPKDDYPMWIIANLAVKDNSPANFPVEMKIDYIRVYQKINSNKTVNICSNSDILGSTIAGQDITVGGSTCSTITIEDNEFLYLVAKNSIELKSDFEVEAGAVFLMDIDD